MSVILLYKHIQMRNTVETKNRRQINQARLRGGSNKNYSRAHISHIKNNPKKTHKLLAKYKKIADNCRTELQKANIRYDKLVQQVFKSTLQIDTSAISPDKLRRHVK